MLREEQLQILRDISQSIAFADDRHGEVEALIVDGSVRRDGDLYELAPKGLMAIEEHANLIASGGSEQT